MYNVKVSAESRPKLKSNISRWWIAIVTTTRLSRPTTLCKTGCLSVTSNRSALSNTITQPAYLTSAKVVYIETKFGITTQIKLYTIGR